MTKPDVIWPVRTTDLYELDGLTPSRSEGLTRKPFVCYPYSSFTALIFMMTARNQIVERSVKLYICPQL